jgi:hypothetical protein
MPFDILQDKDKTYLAGGILMTIFLEAIRFYICYNLRSHSYIVIYTIPI